MDCIQYTPNMVFPYIGSCRVRGILTVCDRDPCSDFRLRSIDILRSILRDEGSLYCYTCLQTIYYLDELDEHGSHLVSYGFLVDESITEDSYIGD